ncbi:hypothetical protein PMAYCL1PPCAC_30037, partial [Pristionchus mayeri]
QICTSSLSSSFSSSLSSQSKHVPDSPREIYSLLLNRRMESLSSSHLYSTFSLVVESSSLRLLYILFLLSLDTSSDLIPITDHLLFTFFNVYEYCIKYF